MQPERTGKRCSYTDEELGQEKTGGRQPRWQYKGFEPGSHSPIRSADMEMAGAFGRLLAEKKASVTPITFNGKLPVSMTFGPHHGCGAGWYDETGSTYRGLMLR